MSLMSLVLVISKMHVILVMWLGYISNPDNFSNVGVMSKNSVILEISGMRVISVIMVI